jgi:hypothetical protein
LDLSPETLENQGIELVTNEGYFEVTKGQKEVTGRLPEVTLGEDEVTTPDELVTNEGYQEVTAENLQAIAQTATQPEANQASLPIYQRSDGGFEVSQPKLRKFTYIGGLPLRFTDSENNEIPLTSEMILIEVRRKANAGYVFITLEGIKCDAQGIRLENLREIQQ